MLGKYFRVSAVPFVPTDISGLQLWLKADSLALNDGDPIGTWTDSSGQGHNATQSSAGLKPLYKTAILNGLPVVRFDGTDDFLGLTILTFTAASVFVVSKQTSAIDAEILGSKDGADTDNQFRARYSGTDKYIVYDGDTNQSGAATSWTSWMLREFTYAGGGTVAFYENGGAIGTATTTQANWKMSAIAIVLGTTLPYNGDIAEVLIYDTVLSSANRALVEGYLNGKWALF